MADSFLVVGLGNPGDKYRDTPHNIGFATVDLLAQRWGATFSKKFKGEFAEVRPKDVDFKVYLLKPMTFMNLSGESAVEVANFFKIPLQTGFLVVTDDIDLPLGATRLRLKGGTGGHNGLRSLVQHLGTEDFPRMRLGVGRSPVMAPDAHVLAKISSGDRAVYERMVGQAADGVERCLKEGVAKAMNTVNQKSEES